MSPTLPPVRTRLTDLAEQAGVSTATVSRVLNGKHGVSAQARQAVLAALDVLGYERPEKLRTRSAGLVGLVVPELSNPVFPAFAQVIESMLTERGYTPLLCTQSPGGTTEDQYVEMLLEHGVAGIVFVSGLHADTSASKERYHRLRSRGMPIVLVNGFAEGVDAPFVSTDDVAALDLAFRHLVSLGHRSIGLAIGPDRFVPAAAQARRVRRRTCERHLGIDRPRGAHRLDAVHGRGRPGRCARAHRVRPHRDHLRLGPHGARRDPRRALPRAARSRRTCRSSGSTTRPLIAFTDPPLTTVRQPVLAMGHAAVSALVAEINGTPASRIELKFHPELIVRGSTGQRRHGRARRPGADRRLSGSPTFAPRLASGVPLARATPTRPACRSAPAEPHQEVTPHP